MTSFLANEGRRAWFALAAAFMGWLGVSLLYSVNTLRDFYEERRIYGAERVSAEYFKSSLGNAALWLTATGIFTLIATAFFILPYVCFRSPDTLLRRKWQLYLYAGCIGPLWFFGSTFLQSASWGQGAFSAAAGVSLYAIITSTISSFFFPRWLKRAHYRAVQQPPQSTLS